MKTSSTSKRLNQLMNERGLRQIDILEKCKPYCEKYGVRLAKNDLSQYVSGKVEPGQDKLSILGLALNVNEVWLMGYDVPMERKCKQQDVIQQQCDDQVSELINKFLKLDADDRQTIADMINSMLNREKYSAEEGLKNA